MTRTTRRQRLTYSALQYSQRDNPQAPTFLIFHARASEIDQWADVDRLEPENHKGAQRPLRGIKVKKIARFLQKNPRNTIPTSIVIALDSSAVKFTGAKNGNQSGKAGTLNIEFAENYKPGLIIDGQHRVYGAKEHSSQTQLNVVAFLGNDDDERAFQFMIINNTATRVNKNHIKALNLKFDKNKLNSRLVESAGLSLGLDDDKYNDLTMVDKTEPFKGLLAWPTNRDGYVQPNAIEQGLDAARDRAMLLGIEEYESDIFIEIWQIIKQIYANAWSKESRLLQKVSINVMTNYVLESMLQSQRAADDLVDFTDEAVLKKHVERVVRRIPEEFWMAEWKVKELDTSAGRGILAEALSIIDSNVRFRRPWADGVSWVDMSSLPTPQTNKRSTQRKGTVRKTKAKARSKAR